MCTEDPTDTGAFYCDCDEGKIDSAYAGLYCEHEATSYCTFNKEVSMISFCTNDGTCKVMVSADSAHLGCDCPTNYEGEHCQFVAGTKPDNWPTSGAGSQALTNRGKQNAANGGISGGVTAVIVIIVFVFLGGIGYMIYRKRTLSASGEKHNIPSSELSLDADGAVLKDSMAMVNTTNGNGDAIEGDDVMEDIKLSGGASEII
jgi:hypothetical protein